MSKKVLDTLNQVQRAWETIIRGNIISEGKEINTRN